MSHPVYEYGIMYTCFYFFFFCTYPSISIRSVGIFIAEKLSDVKAHVRMGVRIIIIAQV